MERTALLLGVDGGASGCRARLCTFSGTTVGEGSAGPANIRFGWERSYAAVSDAASQCLAQAGLAQADFGRVTACLALAGASEPEDLAIAHRHTYPFRHTMITTDAHAACVGAHAGRDGGIVAVGTGVVGWALHDGRGYRVGGWGFPISDEGGGAWLGCEAIRRALWAHDGRIAWTALLTDLFAQFGSDPHNIVRWMTKALPRDFARFAPLVVEHASRDDATAAELMRLAAGHVDALAGRLVSFGVWRLSLVGGLAAHVEPWLPEQTRCRLVAPYGDALSGAVQLARAEAQALVLAG